MSLKKRFGERLKELRVLKNMTQPEFAELVDLETNSLAQIESGRKATSFATLEKISTKANIDYSELFTFEETMKPSALIKSITKELLDLDKDSLRYILASVKQFKKYQQNSR